jgi:carotenoid cleavage dioxygenase-like enzyme
MDHALHHACDQSREFEGPLEIAGQWPVGLGGHAFIIGPAQPTMARFVWTGSGIVTRFDLEERRVRSQFVQTPDLAVLNGLVRSLPVEQWMPLIEGGMPSLTNTSPHFLGDRLLLTFDFMRPIEFDPVTLEFKSYVGNVGEYPAVGAHPLFPSVRTTGHPVEDLDEGCLWFCNANLQPLGGRSSTEVEGTLHLARWDGRGNVDTWHAPGARSMQGIHEVTVTKDFVICIDLGYSPEPGNPDGRRRTLPHRPYTEIWIAAKRDMTQSNRGKAIPIAHARVPQEMFHEFADYRQEGDDLVLYIAHSNGWDLGYNLGESDTLWTTGGPIPPGAFGMHAMTTDVSPIGRYVINGYTGEVKDQKLFLDRRHWGPGIYGRDLRRAGVERGRYMWQSYWGYEPTMVPARLVEMYRNHPYRVVPVEDLPRDSVPSSLVCIDLETMREQSSWSFPEGTFGQAACHVPDPAGGPGWTLCFVQFTDRTELHVFDALDLGSGPVATARAAGFKQSYQVHSGWMETIRSRETGYRRSYADDIGDGWRALGPEVRNIVEPVIARYG